MAYSRFRDLFAVGGSRVPPASRSFPGLHRNVFHQLPLPSDISLSLPLSPVLSLVNSGRRPPRALPAELLRAGILLEPTDDFGLELDISPDLSVPAASHSLDRRPGLDLAGRGSILPAGARSRRLVLNSGPSQLLGRRGTALGRAAVGAARGGAGAEGARGRGGARALDSHLCAIGRLGQGGRAVLPLRDLELG